MSNKDTINDAVQDGGSYEIIKKRLDSKANDVFVNTNKLNDLRKLEFGGTKSEVIGKLNIRTKNNALPVDMAQINGFALFGYNVKLGMKSHMDIEDVLSLHTIDENDGIFSSTSSPIENTFLNDSRFKESFSKLYEYYSNVELIQITKKNGNLLIVFKINYNVDDLKVFRFSIESSDIKYIDDNGIQDLNDGNFHDFEWNQLGRSDFIEGKHSHVSILDKIFIETIGGDLTIKVENNTENGKGIYSEPVDDVNQALSDGEYFFAEIDDLIFLKILPYREEKYRYFIFNSITNDVIKADAIGESCKVLPEGHGVIFSNGYHLASGDTKTFDSETKNLKFFQTIESPNGEDYLYIFFDIHEGFYTLYSYNIIDKEVSTPIHAHGYSIYNDGKILMFRDSENHSASKVHPLRIWQTSFESSEYFLEKTENLEKSFLSNIGNSELVRAISDSLTLVKLTNKEEVTTKIFEAIIKEAESILSTFHWLNNEDIGNLSKDISELKAIADLIVDEFEKVKLIQEKAIEEIESTQKDFKKLNNEVKSLTSKKASDYISLLSKVKQFMGHLISVKSIRYIDLNQIEVFESEIETRKGEINTTLLSLLQKDGAFDHYKDSLNENLEISLSLSKVVEFEKYEDRIETITLEINTVNDEINDIEVKDPTVTSAILDSVSEVFALLNQVKSKVKNHKKSLSSVEAELEFSSQFKLLSQSVSSAITSSETPDKCDEQLARLMGQIDNLESKFSDFDEFIAEIYTKRDEVQETFESHKQQILNSLQKRVGNIVKAAKISLSSISKKVEKFQDADSLNSYFASDSMVLKIAKLVAEIRNLGDSVKSEDISAKFKKIKDQSLRSLRDNNDIFEDNGNIMKMGNHRFSVNKSTVDLTIIPQDGVLKSHLTATDFYEVIDNVEFNSLKDYWELDIISESNTMYRAEFLAYSLFMDIKNSNVSYSFADLETAIKNKNTIDIVREYSGNKYREGYIKGVHDEDAAKIVNSIFNTYSNAGNLSYSVSDRVIALKYMFNVLAGQDTTQLVKRIDIAKTLYNELDISSGIDDICEEILVNMKSFMETSTIEAAQYLVDILTPDIYKSKIEFSKESCFLSGRFDDFISNKRINLFLTEDKEILENEFNSILSWMEGFCKADEYKNYVDFIQEAAMAFVLNKKIKIELLEKNIEFKSTVKDLLGDHNLIKNGELNIFFENFISKCKNHTEIVIPNYNRFLELKKEIADNLKSDLRISDFKAAPLSSFVRNRLITESYLKIIGDNFAKQMGTVGANKRTDLMGMLMLISPPGYGKTTLIEYVASKLGLVFMKINCPSLGHSVTSLDPSDAPDATSRQEVEKINLAFEMGNNVLLYLDDIQHTNSEFLQKFISLCDGTRKVDGVWKGKTKTYDMKGKKFAVVMAGNPYTESGDTFNIPDMLSNRADTYNLGDMLSDQAEVFELSYIENSLTSNPVLAPLATRDLNDLYKIIEMTKGKDVALTDLEYNYSATEVDEIKLVLNRMYTVRDVILKVNQQYIKSAAIDDNYREEPSFKLQGSYRNMNKMVEKILPVMNDTDIDNLIMDHYLGESQTLSSGSEENLLKLKELLGILSATELERWNSIKSDFLNIKVMGDGDTDGAVKIANQLSSINKTLLQQ